MLSTAARLFYHYKVDSVKSFYKSDGKTGLNDAEIGSEFTTGQFAEKNAKMRGVGYLVD